MKRIPHTDGKGKLYYPITLIDSEGLFAINGINYSLDLKRLKRFPTFRCKTLRVERDHPTVTDVNDFRYKRTDIDCTVGSLCNLTIIDGDGRSFQVKADFYPNPKMTQNDLLMFEGGLTDLGVRAIVDPAKNIEEIITWDLIPVCILTVLPVEDERPPVNEIVFVSSNQGYTWFPAKFLWLGEKTFVWRNMLPGAKADGEITNDNRFTYFRWAKVIPELELKTYAGDDRPEYLLSRSYKPC